MAISVPLSVFVEFLKYSRKFDKEHPSTDQEVEFLLDSFEFSDHRAVYLPQRKKSPILRCWIGFI
jgi:hypothetical protein